MDGMRKIGKYILLDKLAQGGMAEVFLAKALGVEGFEKILVIKRLLPKLAFSEKLTTMFIDEAKISVSLNHPNIVQVFDFGKEEGYYYLAMEYVEGISLYELLLRSQSKSRPLPFGLAAFIIIEVAKGLDYAHRKCDPFGNPLKIIHRDISPQNILISNEGMVKIVDFGIAKARDAAGDDLGEVKGKISYMSPEQARAMPVDHRSDIYSAGVLLYEMLTRRPAYDLKDQSALLRKVARAKLPPPRALQPDIPEQLDAIVRRALAPDIIDRYTSALAMHEELREFIHGLPEVYDSVQLVSLLQRIKPEIIHHKLAAERPYTEITGLADAEDLPTIPGELSDFFPETIVTGKENIPLWHEEETKDHATNTLKNRFIGERKNVVLIYADPIGFTELFDNMDEDHARRIISQTMSMIEGIMYKHGGTIEILNHNEMAFVFGAPTSHENDAERAAISARDIHEIVVEVARNYNVEMGLGIGINRGKIFVEHLDKNFRIRTTAIGSVLRYARRLADLAEAGEILVSELVRSTLYRMYEFQERKPVRLKGKKEPLRVFKLKGLQPMESRITPVPRARFIGRRKELKTLRNAYTEAIQSRSAVAVGITGEAGIGKKTLLSTFLSEFDTEAVWIAHCRNTYQVVQNPLSSLHDVIHSLLTINLANRDTAVMANSLEESCREILPDINSIPHILPVMGKILSIPIPDETFDALDAANFSDLLKKTIALFFEGLARERPLIIAWEEIQWTDFKSKEFLAHFLKQETDAPVLILLSSRPEEPALDTLLSETNRCHRFTLKDLTDSEVKELLQNRLQHFPHAREMFQEIMHNSGGNPLYIEEILAHLSEQHGKPKENLVIPGALEELVTSRIDRLKEDEKSLLKRASVVGERFWKPLMDHLIKDNTAPQLKALVKHGLILPTGTEILGERYTFKHAVLKEIVYDGVMYKDRKVLHGQIADWLSTNTKGTSFNTIGFHYEKAGDLPMASDFYMRAARHASEIYANREAIGFYQKVLRIHKRDPVQLKHLPLADIHEQLGACYRATGSFDMALEHYWKILNDQSLIPNAPERLAGINRKIGNIYVRQGHYQQALEKFEEAFKILENIGNSKEMALILENTGWLEFRRGNIQEAEKLFNSCLEVAIEVEDQFNVAAASNRLAAVYGCQGNYQKAVAFHKRSLEIRLEISDRQGIAQSYNNLGCIFVDTGKFKQAHDCFEKALQRWDDVGNQFGVGIVSLNLGETSLAQEEVEQARYHFKLAYKIAEQVRGQELRAEAVRNLAETDLLSGRIQRALDRGVEALKLNLDIGHGRAIGISQRVLGCIYDRIGNRKEAQRLLKASVETLKDADQGLELGKSYYHLAHFEPKNAEKHFKAAQEIFYKTGNQYWIERLKGRWNL